MMRAAVDRRDSQPFSAAHRSSAGASGRGAPRAVSTRLRADWLVHLPLILHMIMLLKRLLTVRFARRVQRSMAGIGILLWLATAPAFAQRELQTIPPPDPELERQSFVLPPGLEVNLFAADPEIAKPIQMNFDPQGRLWVVSSQTYPQIVPGEPASDKVLVLEDRDGDGVSDQTTVFADGLLIPTGIEPGDGGAYVAASTELLHLRDTDGDGRADRRDVVLSGFGTEDTHHLIHTFRWGPEQRLYFLQSIYIHSHVETPWGPRRLNAGGVWRFRPEDWRLEVFARGWINPWGLDFDPYGQTFVTDGAGGEGINFAVPGASYATAFGAPRILPGLNPGSPKHCGLEIVSGRHFPDDWQGNLITCDFRGHRVCRFVLRESAAAFDSLEQPELIRSDHVAFRPIDVKMGPDGALYIADWYNPIIQHGEVDFRDARRDHTHGRIWRVSFAGRPLVPRPQLLAMSDDQLVRQLEVPELWTRHQAKRLLTERGPEVLPAVRQWARSLDNTAPGYHQLRLEALRVYQAHDVVEPELLESLLRCGDHQARAAAVRVVGDWAGRLDDPLALLTPRASDEHPRVRLETVRVLATIREPAAMELACRVLDPEVPSGSAFMTPAERQINKPEPKSVDMDPWLDYALWLTARDLQPVWQPALLKGEIDFAGTARHLTYVLTAAGSPETMPLLLDLLRTGKISGEEWPGAVRAVGQHGDPAHLQDLLDLAIAEADEPVLRDCLEQLLASTASRKIRPAAPTDALRSLLSGGTDTLQQLSLQCAGAWQVTGLLPQITALAQDASAGLALRQAAVTGLSSFDSPEAAAALEQLASSEASLELRREAVAALLSRRPRVAAQLLLPLLQSTESPVALQPVLGAFLRSQPAREALPGVLNNQTISSDAAIVALRVIRSSGQSLPELSEALSRAGQLSSGPRQLTPDEMVALASEVEMRGDPARGEQVYRRSELNCLKCHAIGGSGGAVGPDLLSLGATAQTDYIIDALLDPNKQVKENFHTMIVVTSDGQTYSGIVVRQTDSDLLLRDAEGREQAVPLRLIELQSQGISLMPAGLTEKLTRDELIDLAAFLKALGRLPGYVVTPSPVVRNWQVLVPTPEAALRLRRESFAAGATDDESFQWLPSVSRVDGWLPLAEMSATEVQNRVAAGSRGMTFVRTHFEAPSDGERLFLKINDATGLLGWWNGEPIEVTGQMELMLRKGENRLSLAIDLAARTTDLRLERVE
jgi:putative heme-binding domain-containing protein